MCINKYTRYMTDKISSLPNFTMKGFALSQSSKHWHPTIHNPTTKYPNKSLKTIPLQLPTIPSSGSRRRRQISLPSFAICPYNADILPLVVVGSANADIYVEIDRFPKEGESILAKGVQTIAGGKGANQAACGSKLSHPTFFMGMVGEDAYGKMITEALEGGGVHLDHLTTVFAAPTGHAVVMLQSDGENSIIIVGGANMCCWPERLSEKDLEIIRNARIVLLQREIPDSVNIEVAKAARRASVPVILDAGGVDAPLPSELLNFVDILSPNETELARLTGMPVENFEQISQAAVKCHKMGAKEVLVKLGSKGSVLFVEGKEPIKQPIVFAAKVLDTTGAGDTFIAAFAVALVEGKSKKECLRFAAAAASLCVQRKGAIPSMPDRKSVVDLLQSL